MSNERSKAVRSPPYPSISLREAVDGVGEIEGKYRSAPVDRTVAAKLIGFSALSGPANKALAALSSYGLVQRAGKGEIRVTERARAILHATSDEEKRRSLREASSEPRLFRDILERFPDIKPPKDGVLAYLAREGFNQNVINRAANAFLDTMSYIEEESVTESHGSTEDAMRESGASGGNAATSAHSGARVGDLIQWEPQGVRQFKEPRRVRLVTEDGEWVAVEGSETGIPMNEVIVKDRASAPATPGAAPRFPISDMAAAEKGEGTDIRLKLGKGIVVQVRSPDELGANELDKLLKLLEAQRDALKD